MGKFRIKTIDTAHLRIKYFFGYGYSYGEGRGREKFYSQRDISPIPDWIKTDIIKRMEDVHLVPPGWINSVVINDYESGGFIVSHQDPFHLFKRPIFILTLLSGSALSFDSTFNFDRSGKNIEISCSDPSLRLPMYRGILTSFEGYNMDNVSSNLFQFQKSRIAF